MWAKQPVYRLRRAEGMREGVFKGWGSIIIGVGEHDPTNRAPRCLRSSAEGFRSGDDHCVPPDEAGALSELGSMLRSQYVHGFHHGGTDALSEMVFAEQKCPFSWGERNVEAAEKAVSGVWLDACGIGNIGEEAGRRHPRGAGILGHKPERRVKVNGQVRYGAELENCLALCRWKLREEMFCHEFRTGENDGSRLNGNNALGCAAEGAEACAREMFAVKGGMVTADALCPELFGYPLAEGAESAGHRIPPAFAAELIAEEVLKAVRADTIGRSAHR